jgi:pimeloyl-ACP methyl ester carboxylesterase
MFNRLTADSTARKPGGIIRISRRGKLGLVLAAAAAAVTVAVPASQIASAQTARATIVTSLPKPTIVLVHGAWASTSSWDGFIQRLQHLGYKVYAPANPLLGLTYDDAYISDFLHSISGPIVLVGHSYGGAVITNAATGDKQVKALVYVDAFLPNQGESVGQLVSARPGSCVAVSDPATIFRLVPYPGAPAGAVDAYLKQNVFPNCIANGLPRSEQQTLAVTQLPLTTLALSQKSGVPAWKTIPSWAVVGTADHTIPPAEQMFMAERAHAHITQVNAGSITCPATSLWLPS